MKNPGVQKVVCIPGFSCHNLASSKDILDIHIRHSAVFAKQIPFLLYICRARYLLVICWSFAARGVCRQIPALKLQKAGLYYPFSGNIVRSFICRPFEEDFIASTGGPNCPELYETHRGIFWLEADYGNRGMTFESLIEYANRRYRLDKRAIIEKQHTLCKPLRDSTGRIASAKYEEKATVDFMGRFFLTPIAFEAKHCATDKIDLKRVEEHQCDFLRDWTHGGGTIGFVLVSFELTAFYIIPWDYWQAALTAREKKTKGTVQFYPMQTAWETTSKASIRRDELPAEWEVKIGGTAGLDYLAVVSRLWKNL